MGQAEHYIQNRKGRKGPADPEPAEWDRRNRKDKIGPKAVQADKRSRTKQAGQDWQNRTARTGLPG
jgi:hypothetical protein